MEHVVGHANLACRTERTGNWVSSARLITVPYEIMPGGRGPEAPPTLRVRIGEDQQKREPGRHKTGPYGLFRDLPGVQEDPEPPRVVLPRNLAMPSSSCLAEGWIAVTPPSTISTAPVM